MPSGAAVIRYEGRRGVVWRLKYGDAAGKQIMETLGPERDGWTRRKAQAELRERLVRVERQGYRRPKPLTFAEYAAVWFEEGERKRRWKPRTVLAYRTVIGRLVDHFGHLQLGQLGPEHVADYRPLQPSRRPYGAASVNRDLSLLFDVFRTAQRKRLVAVNPVDGAERPKLPRRRWRILEPAEVGRVARAFTDPQARTAFLTLVLTGVRRSELEALRWRDVDLVDGVLRVRESKSEEGIRSIALSSTLVEELWQHCRRSSFQGEDERVFCHPERGTLFSATAFSEALRAALRVAGVEGHVRPFHDLRHASLTNGAAAGESPIALMTRAGHRSMKTTGVYLHLAGVVFRDEAERLEQRLLVGAGTELSTELSTDLS